MAGHQVAKNIHEFQWLRSDPMPRCRRGLGIETEGVLQVCLRVCLQADAEATSH